MKRRPRDIGTAAETAVVRYLVASGFPHAERRSLRGALDAGDITGTPGVCWEVKGGDAARTASDLDITRWMSELAAEMVNAHASVGLLVVQRVGVGPANAGRWWAIMPAGQITYLSGTPTVAPGPLAFPVRMLLVDAVGLLRAAGYGEPVACTHELHGADRGRCPDCGWDSHPIPTEPAGPWASPLPPMPAGAVARG